MTTVLTLLGGAAAAALIGLLGAWVQSRRDVLKWVREERFKFYSEALSIIDRMELQARTEGGKSTKAFKKDWRLLSGMQGRATLLGPDQLAIQWAQLITALGDVTPEGETKTFSGAKVRMAVAVQQALGTRAAIQVDRPMPLTVAMAFAALTIAVFAILI